MLRSIGRYFLDAVVYRISSSCSFSSNLGSSSLAILADEDLDLDTGVACIVWKKGRAFIDDRGYECAMGDMRGRSFISLLRGIELEGCPGFMGVMG